MWLGVIHKWCHGLVVEHSTLEEIFAIYFATHADGKFWYHSIEEFNNFLVWAQNESYSILFTNILGFKRKWFYIYAVYRLCIYQNYIFSRQTAVWVRLSQTESDWLRLQFALKKHNSENDFICVTLIVIHDSFALTRQNKYSQLLSIELLTINWAIWKFIESSFLLVQ